MGSEAQSLHIFFFPFMAHGHMLPTIDMAKLFASRGARTALVTTPLNAPNFSNTIDRSQKLGIKIEVKTINFPPVDQSGLPQGCEHLDLVSSREMVEKFFLATTMLKEPLEQLLNECRPDCLVADMFFPWATDVASKFGIPRLLFHGTSFFSLCASECIRLYKPHLDVSSDSDPFVIPHFPDEISLTRSQLPEHMRHEVENDFTRLLQECKESEVKSYGVIVNSFYELEPAYADYFRNVLGRTAWHIGPVSLCNRDLEDKAQRGCKKANINEHECLNWLDTRAPNSVIYVSFGSIAKFRAEQLREIAHALEDSGQDFIWVVRKLEDGTEKQDWLPEGFEERMAGKGLIIDEWAPQVLILDHMAVGAFVTHCGWNSTLEGICAGVPMVTWPVSAEQFYNEKLVVQVLKIGVGVGAQQWVSFVGDYVKRDAIEKALTRVMVGEDAGSMRNRAKELAKLSREATVEGGSSYNDLNALIKQLMDDGNSGKKAGNKILD